MRIFLLGPRVATRRQPDSAHLLLPEPLRRQLVPAPALHAWPLEGIPPLPLPSEARRPWPGVAAVTGGGLAARVTAADGLREVWRERSSEDPGDTSRALTLPEDFCGAGLKGSPSARSAPFLVPGGWSRPLAGGREERGMLLDSFPVVVIQRLAPGSPPTVLSTHLLAPGDVSHETCRRLSAAIPARVLRRLARGHDETRLELSGSPGLGEIPAALQTLDDAPFSNPVDAAFASDATASANRGSRLPALVGGVTGDRLLQLGPAPLVEVALGALAGGRWPLAASIVDAVLAAGDRGTDRDRDGNASPAARLLLATRWAVWTGEVERLRAHGEVLDAAARRLVAQGEQPAPRMPDLPAAFPSTWALLADFADAVEPLGDRSWVADLRRLAQEAETARSAAAEVALDPVPGIRPVRGVRLPVLGSTPAPAVPELDETPGPRPAPAHLPPVDAFASPDHSSVAPRRTVHAARLVRSAVEGLCGVRPDAAWGRVTLAPDLRGLSADESGVRHLVARGIRVGDVRIDLDCRVSRMGGTLRVSQVTGRVPINVVFEPCLPLAGVGSVRLGGTGGPEKDADVEIEVLEDGVRLRFQFPLDPERRVSVDGAP